MQGVKGNQENRTKEAKVKSDRNPKVSLPYTSAKATAISLNSNDCRPYGGKLSAPASYDQLVELRTDFFLDGNGVIRSGFNKISYKVNRKPVIFQVLEKQTLPEHVHPIRTPLGQVIFFIPDCHMASILKRISCSVIPDCATGN